MRNINEEYSKFGIEAGKKIVAGLKTLAKEGIIDFKEELDFFANETRGNGGGAFYGNPYSKLEQMIAYLHDACVLDDELDNAASVYRAYFDDDYNLKPDYKNIYKNQMRKYTKKAKRTVTEDYFPY